MSTLTMTSSHATGATGDTGQTGLSGPTGPTGVCQPSDITDIDVTLT